MRYFVKFPTGDEVPVDIQVLPSGEMDVAVDGVKVPAEVLGSSSPRTGSGPLALRVGAHTLDLWLEGSPPDVGVVAKGLRFYARVESERMRALDAALGPHAGAGEGLVVSPMPGRVLKVLVKEGDPIARGAALVVVEAMKMENELTASRDGTVAKVFVTPGQTVESGTHLVEIA